MLTNNLLVFDSDGDQCTYNGYDYNTLYSMSKNEDYAEFKDTSLVGDLGDSPLGYKVIAIIPAITKSACLNPEKAIRYAISRLHSLTKKPYAIIVCQTCACWSESQEFYFAKTWFDLLPQHHKSQMQKVYLVHSGYTMGTIMSLSSSLTGKSAEKIVILDKLSDALMQLDVYNINNVRFFPYLVHRYEEINLGHETPVTVFGSDFSSLCIRFGKPFKGLDRIPPFLSKLINLLESQPSVTTRQLFDLQSDAPELYGMIGDIENQGERALTSTNIPALVYSFRLLLDSQFGGLMGPSSYQKLKLLGSDPSDEALESLIKTLISSQNVDRMSCVYLILLLFENLLKYSKSNGLTLGYLGELFGATFFRPHIPDPNCSKYIPAATRAISIMVKKRANLFESLGLKFNAIVKQDETGTFEDVTFNDSSSSYPNSSSSSNSGSYSYTGSDTGSVTGSSGSDTGSSGSDTGSVTGSSGSDTGSSDSDTGSVTGSSGSDTGSITGSDTGSDTGSSGSESCTNRN